MSLGYRTWALAPAIPLPLRLAEAISEFIGRVAVFVQAARIVSVAGQTLYATAKIVRVYALDFGQPVEVTVCIEDLCQAVLEHHSGVGFSRRPGVPQR